MVAESWWRQAHGRKRKRDARLLLLTRGRRRTGWLGPGQAKEKEGPGGLGQRGKAGEVMGLAREVEGAEPERKGEAKI